MNLRLILPSFTSFDLSDFVEELSDSADLSVRLNEFDIKLSLISTDSTYLSACWWSS